MKNNICTTKRQTLSIQTENQLYDVFPQLSKRKIPIESQYEASKNNSDTLSVIDAKLGNGTSLRWLKVQIVDVLTYLGAFQQTNEYQVISLARHIRAKYYYLTLSEITYFFEAFEDGSYGTMFVGKTINPQNIMEALKKYENDALAERDRIYNEEQNERLSEQIAEEKDKKRKGHVGYDAWLRYCKRTNRKDTILPGINVKLINQNENRN